MFLQPAFLPQALDAAVIICKHFFFYIWIDLNFFEY